MNDYRYEIKQSISGGYQFSVWTPEGQLLNHPINLIPFAVLAGPVGLGSYFSGLSMTLWGAEMACRNLTKAHRQYGFIKTGTNGTISEGTL